MPLIKALRKRKRQIQLLGETAVIRLRGEDGGVDVYDLVRRYATGELPLGDTVEQIAARVDAR